MSAEVVENEEVLETEDTNDDTNDRKLEDASNEDLVKKIRELNRENARYRTKARDMESEVERLKPFELETLTEKEKLEAKIKDLTEELAPIKTEKAQKAAAVAAGLDLSYADLVVGDTDEARRESAEKLAKRLPKPEEKKEAPVEKDNGSLDFDGNAYFGGPAGKKPVKGSTDEPFWKNLFD